MVFMNRIGNLIKYGMKQRLSRLANHETLKSEIMKNFSFDMVGEGGVPCPLLLSGPMSDRGNR